MLEEHLILILLDSRYTIPLDSRLRGNDKKKNNLSSR